MNCIVEDLNRARRVIKHLGERPDVIGTDLVSPAIDPSGRWTIEFALDADGVPPGIVSLLGDAGMTIWDVGPAAVVVALRSCRIGTWRSTRKNREPRYCTPPRGSVCAKHCGRYKDRADNKKGQSLTDLCWMGLITLLERD